MSIVHFLQTSMQSSQLLYLLKYKRLQVVPTVLPTTAQCQTAPNSTKQRNTTPNSPNQQQPGQTFTKQQQQQWQQHRPIALICNSTLSNQITILCSVYDLSQPPPHQTQALPHRLPISTLTGSDPQHLFRTLLGALTRNSVNALVTAIHCLPLTVIRRQ